MCGIVRLASVGLGGWGNVLAEAAGRRRTTKIVRCFDVSGAASGAFADKFACHPATSLEELLKDNAVEGVLIATPHSTHAKIACQAAAAGKHIFIEKPFTLNARDAKRSINAAERAGLVLQVGHKRRWFAGNRHLRKMIETGELGMVHQLEGNYSRPTMQTPVVGWRNDPTESPVGGMTGLGIHIVYLFHSFAGPVKRLYALSKKLLGKSNLDDVTSIVLEYESGPLGYIGTSTVTPMNVTVAAFGTKAGAWSMEDGTRLYLQKRDEPLRKEISIGVSDGVADELDHFAKCIRNGSEPDAGKVEGLEVTAVLEAVIESVRSGQAVDVSPFRA